MLYGILTEAHSLEASYPRGNRCRLVVYVNCSSNNKATYYCSESLVTMGEIMF